MSHSLLPALRRCPECGEPAIPGEPSTCGHCRIFGPGTVLANALSHEPSRLAGSGGPRTSDAWIAEHCHEWEEAAE